MPANTTTITTERSESKVVRARQIFGATTGLPRRLVVARFENELDMTPAAASTYYQNCRVDAGLVRPRGKQAQPA